MRSFLFLLGIISFFTFVACEDQSSPVANNSNDTENFRGNLNDRNTTLDDGDYAEFEITVYNLTPATQPGASQPFSPPVFATHTPLYHVWQLGRLASSEVAQVAEDAVSGPLIEQLGNSDFVKDVVTGNGVILPGQSATLNIKGNLQYRKLSAVWMLVNTNDAFSGLDGTLPRVGSKTLYLKAYDAGSEKNTESSDHIPGPCCGNPLVRVPTQQPIHPHSGIKGNGDLDPAVYDWDGSVAKVVITRIN